MEGYDAKFEPSLNKRLECPICLLALREPYRITRMFCEHQTFANFAMVDQFATIKSAKPKLLLVNTRSLPERNS